MITKILENFSIDQIHHSGQCFRMEEIGDDRYKVLAGERYLELTQRGKECGFSCTEEEFSSFWEEYFDLKKDYKSYLQRIDRGDLYLIRAGEKGWGIRILRQDLWEMIVSFLISQQNNIPRIRRCIQNICEKYGERKRTEDGKEYWAFPSPKALAQAEEEDLRGCNLGYRSRYILRTARMVTEGEIDLEYIKNASYQEARQELLKCCGVGEKVADCICLFALHHLEAFPVDTHIRQALENHYPQGFPFDRYREFAGVLQQYIFYYDLNGGK